MSSTNVAKEKKEFIGGIIHWGFDDMKPNYKYSTSIKVDDKFQKKVRDKSFLLIQEKEWISIIKTEPEFIPFSKTNELLAYVYIKQSMSNGDCMFDSICMGYNQLFTTSNKDSNQNYEILDVQTLRNLAANQLTEKNIDEYVLQWSPKSTINLIKDKKKKCEILQYHLRKTGFWGDFACLSLLILNTLPFKKFKLGFAVIAIQNKKIFTQIARLPETQHLMFLYNYSDKENNDNHYVLLGIETPPPFLSTNNGNSAREKQIKSIFPLVSYPPALFPYLQMK